MNQREMQELINSKSNTYTASFYCNNCGRTFSEQLPKGQRATCAGCPNCGCTANKGYPWSKP